MKNILYAFILSASVILSATAQQDTRTSVTKVADLLAQQPAQTTQQFVDAMAELERFTAADIAALLGQLKPEGTGDDSGVEYAANSYSYHVLQNGKERQRATFVEGALTALEQAADRDNKGFIIQMLQNAGKDDAVPALATYLSDSYLAEKAARALGRIGSEAAGAALLSSLSTADAQTAVTTINALGFMRYAPAEQALLERLATADEGNKRVILYALSEIAGAASESALRKEAARADYVYEPTNAADAYVAYGQRLAEKGNTRLATSVANRIYKQAKQPHQAHNRVAALDLLAQLKGVGQVKNLVKGARDKDPLVRHASQRLLAPHLTPAIATTLLSGLDRQDPRVQADVLAFMSANGIQAAVPVATRLLESADAGVRQQAVKTLFALSGSSTLPTLVALLPNADPSVQATIQDVLLRGEGTTVVPLLVGTLTQTQDPNMRKLALDVLGKRAASEATPAILNIVNDRGAAPDVRAAAYQALAHTSGPGDLESLLGQLGQVEGDQAALVESAIIAAITRSENPAQQRDKTISYISKLGAQSLPKYLPVLAGVGGPQALSLVESHLANTNAAVSASAFSALARWSDEEALPVLIERSRQQNPEAQQREIVDGIIRLVGGSQATPEQKTLWLRDAFEVAADVAQQRRIISALESTQTYNALMFAAGLLDNGELRGAALNTMMNIALERKDFYGDDVKALLNRAADMLSGSESSYLREALMRHIAELPEDKGWVSLFNGKDLTGWKGLVENPIARARMTPSELAEKQAAADRQMREGWYVEGGVLHFNGNGDNIATVKQYGDFEMLVDWKLAKEGKDGDAGIYLRGTPQVQIWDTSRVEVGAQVGSGGLYNNQKHESKPLLVADNELGEWNTFLIRMVGDKVTVYLNGQLVTDNVVLENFWDRSQPIFPVEQIELQAHGTHVSYRDLYIRELPGQQVFELSDAEKAEGFEVLFDGTSMDKWTGNTDSYGVSEEGTLAIVPTQGSGGNLYTKEQFGDFVYRFEFRLTPGANNGIGVRTPREGDAAYEGMEIQVLDDGADMYKDLENHQYHGSVYGIIAAKRGHLKPVGEWNEQEIYMKGNKIRVTLNGTVIVDGDLAEATKNGTLDGRDHPGLKRTSGHIAFLGHGSEVHFRNIRIKRL